MQENIIEQEKDEKVEVKSAPKKTQKTKKCKVLVYNGAKQTAIISFDGYGFEIKNVKENPGEFLNVKYKGDIDSADFTIL